MEKCNVLISLLKEHLRTCDNCNKTFNEIIKTPLIQTFLKQLGIDAKAFLKND